MFASLVACSSAEEIQPSQAAAVDPELGPLVSFTGPNEGVGCADAWQEMLPAQRRTTKKLTFTANCLNADYVSKCSDGFIDIFPDSWPICLGHGRSVRHFVWVDG